MFAGQHRLEPFLDQLPPRPLNIGDAGVQGLGDPAIAPAFPFLRHISLQKDARLRQQLRRALSRADQSHKLFPLVGTQPDNVFLDGNIFPGHESPPSLLRYDSDSQLAVEINDGGH